MPTKTDTIYTRVVQVSEDYLGPAGERFIRRQIVTHLGIKPESLKRSQIPKLITWTSMAFALLTNNKNDQADFTEDLLALSLQQPD